MKIQAAIDSDCFAAFGCWSNDRHAPIYSRADKAYSDQNASHLDACMELAQLPMQEVRAWTKKAVCDGGIHSLEVS
jgi:hypothetical protein